MSRRAVRFRLRLRIQMSQVTTESVRSTKALSETPWIILFETGHRLVQAWTNNIWYKVCIELGSILNSWYDIEVILFAFIITL